MRIGVKFCGGCHPVVDRVAIAAEVIKVMEPLAAIVPYGDAEADLVLVFVGCPAACPDVRGIADEKLRYIGSYEDADLFLRALKKLFPDPESGR
ncbi:hypothetical protein OOT00_10145 [Desulfobotulus sp. H1]|uniref:Uncharacterized protein n=1 Tax=Desulfobotulus pelophilus TaxID=2823377 RepID=A0ABT3NA49_9BACT|nr:hypothetical protein [Desulfobotulus pelophilus]MCW7754346.1 hypothetical protein [Desulfobotulus pelophilus]